VSEKAFTTVAFNSRRINSAIEQSSLPDPNPTFDTGLPIVNESNEDAKKVRYNGRENKVDGLGSIVTDRLIWPDCSADNLQLITRTWQRINPYALRGYTDDTV